VQQPGGWQRMFARQTARPPTLRLPAAAAIAAVLLQLLQRLSIYE